MVAMTDIHPLTSFQRDAKGYIDRLKRTGKPEVLTVNGRAAVVVQDADSYQMLLDRLDSIEGIRRGLESARRGEGIPLPSFAKQMRTKYSRKTK